MNDLKGDSLSIALKNPINPNRWENDSKVFNPTANKVISWFNNLYEDKFIIRRDGQISLVRLTDLNTDNLFSANIDLVYHLNLDDKNDYFPNTVYFSLQLWKTQLKIIDEKHRTFSIKHPKDIIFWTEPTLVMYLQKLAVYGDYNDIHQLIRENLLKPI